MWSANQIKFQVSLICRHDYARHDVKKLLVIHKEGEKLNFDKFQIKINKFYEFNPLDLLKIEAKILELFKLQEKLFP